MRKFGKLKILMNTGTFTVKKIWNNEKNFAVEMTDGTKITHRKNENFGVVEGQTYDFTWTTNNVGGKVYLNMTGAKPAGSGGSQAVSQPSSGRGNVGREIMAQVAFKGLIELAAAGVLEVVAIDAASVSNYTDIIEAAAKGVDPFANE